MTQLAVPIVKKVKHQPSLVRAGPKIHVPQTFATLRHRPVVRPPKAFTAKGYGWIPDFRDQRDFLYAAPPMFLRALPPNVDLRDQCPLVHDQGQLGSCTPNAIGGAIEPPPLYERRSTICFTMCHVNRRHANELGSAANGRVR
jgi:hypothetical protein